MANLHNAIKGYLLVDSKKFKKLLDLRNQAKTMTGKPQYVKLQQDQHTKDVIAAVEIK